MILAFGGLFAFSGAVGIMLTSKWIWHSSDSGDYLQRANNQTRIGVTQRIALLQIKARMSSKHQLDLIFKAFAKCVIC